MLARLRGWFWWRLYALAGRRWERAYDDAHPDQGPTGDAGEYRWVVEDAAYAPVWSDVDGAEMVDGEPVWSERNQRANYDRIRAAGDAKAAGVR